MRISQSGRDYDTFMHNLHKFYSVRHARMTSRMFKAFQTRRLKPKEIFTNVIYYAFFSPERIQQMWTPSNRAINGYNQTSICTQIQTKSLFSKASALLGYCSHLFIWCCPSNPVVNSSCDWSGLIQMTFTCWLILEIT